MICQCGKEIVATTGRTMMDHWTDHLNGKDGSTCGQTIPPGTLVEITEAEHKEMSRAYASMANVRKQEDPEIRLAIMALNDTVKAMHAEIRELRREVRYGKRPQP